MTPFCPHCGAELDPQRSKDQSAYLYAEPLKKFMAGDPELAGCTPAHAKLILLGRYFGWEHVKGLWLPAKVSTADLTKSEFTGFIEFLIQDGAEMGINVCPPERDPSRRDPRVYLDDAVREKVQKALAMRRTQRSVA